MERKSQILGPVEGIGLLLVTSASLDKISDRNNAKEDIHFNAFSERFPPSWQERHGGGSGSVRAGGRMYQRLFISWWTGNRTQAENRGREG